MNTRIDPAMRQACLRPMVAADLESVLKLRNHVEVRRYMLTQHEISIEEHSAWFNRMLQTSGVELLVFELDKICCGFVQFKETNCRGVVEWGLYVAPDAPKGTGRELGLAALAHAFKKENLNKICGQVLQWNRSSIGLHQSLGFVQEGVLRDQQFDGTVYHNLICFGMLAREWVAKEALPEINK